MFKLAHGSRSCVIPSGGLVSADLRDHGYTAHMRAGVGFSPRGNRLRGVRRTGRTSRPARLVRSPPPAPRPGHVAPGPAPGPGGPRPRGAPERPPARAPCVEKMLKALSNALCGTCSPLLAFESLAVRYLAPFTPQLSHCEVLIHSAHSRRHRARHTCACACKHACICSYGPALASIGCCVFREAGRQPSARPR